MSVAVTLDGYMDTVESGPLRISSERDLLEVHRLRAKSDAILVGAETLRKDNCRLTVRHGLEESGQPARITLTRTGRIDLNGRFFTLDGSKKVIFCPKSVAAELFAKLPDEAQVVAFNGESCQLPVILETLKADGVKELLIEGGASLIGQFLKHRLVDRVRLAISPQIIGSAGKTRLFEPALTKGYPDTAWRFNSVENFDETVVIWYEVDNAAAH